jgi:hypothetical protein
MDNYSLRTTPDNVTLYRINAADGSGTNFEFVVVTDMGDNSLRVGLELCGIELGGKNRSHWRRTPG